MSIISNDRLKSRLAGPSSKKVKFTKNEDAKLESLIKEYGEGEWKLIAEKMSPRTARQCRERWTNYVNPKLSKDPWTKEEDDLLMEKHREHGNKWKIIEKYFPTRSKNNIKQRFMQLKEVPVIEFDILKSMDDDVVTPLYLHENEPINFYFDRILEQNEGSYLSLLENTDFLALKDDSLF